MYWYNTGWGLSFFGMSMLWWLFWLVVIALFFTFATPAPRWRKRDERDSALAILARRYAAGELDTAEYEARRERIQRDLAPESAERRDLPPASPPPPSPPPPSRMPTEPLSSV